MFISIIYNICQKRTSVYAHNKSENISRLQITRLFCASNVVLLVHNVYVLHYIYLFMKNTIKTVKNSNAAPEYATEATSAKKSLVFIDQECYSKLLVDYMDKFRSFFLDCVCPLITKFRGEVHFNNVLSCCCYLIFY